MRLDPEDRHALFLALAALALLLALCLLKGWCAEPWSAVVRVPSHGASATVIHTEEGRSLLLGCAHAYEGQGRYQRHVVNAPAPAAGRRDTGGRIRLVRLDPRLDLSLLEIAAGPLPYVCPVAPAGHRPGRLVTAGYDEMRVLAGSRPTVRPATLLRDAGNETWTRERPWHGRSGGALIDLDAGRLVGVVSAYTGPRDRREVSPGGWGVHVSHRAILRFLGSGSGDSPAPGPRGPQDWVPAPVTPDGCPDGRCPPRGAPFR